MIADIALLALMVVGLLAIWVAASIRKERRDAAGEESSALFEVFVWAAGLTLPVIALGFWNSQLDILFR